MNAGVHFMEIIEVKQVNDEFAEMGRTVSGRIAFL